MKVLMIHPSSVRKNWKSDGIATYCKTLYSLFKDNQDVEILPVPDIPVVKCKLLKNYFRWKDLVNILEDSEADIVHINGYTSLMSVQPFLALRKSSKKIVYTAHWHPFEYLGRPITGKIFFYLLMKPLISKYADTIITINKEDTAFFRKFHHHVIQIPHSVPDFANRQRQVGIEKDPKMVLFVGNMSASNKGAEYIYHLPEGKYEIHCVSANILKKRSDIIQHKAISNEELRNMYVKASLLIVPSKYEAFSYVSLEALSVGTPVVMSDRVRIADYLAGVKGVRVFKYGDYNDFVKAVEDTIGNEVDVQLINKTFSGESVKTAYEKAYIETL